MATLPKIGAGGSRRASHTPVSRTVDGQASPQIHNDGRAAAVPPHMPVLSALEDDPVCSNESVPR